jgi:N6-L-threonylcarbamoyladenine synthase
MMILGIETSCDETAVAIVNDRREVLAQSLQSQTREHVPYGGVVPEIAARSHLHYLRTQYAHALAESGLTLSQVDAIAVTAGPGLIGGVMVGLMFAKGLASAAKKPLVAVNHLEGHALTARFTDAVEFPYALMLLSGGHCQILEVQAVGQYRLLGATRDDALGEAYDKTAKMMGIAYPGGAAMEALARSGDAKRFALPRPMIGTDSCDFSFSGLKTAVRLALMEITCTRPLTEQDKADMAASFEAAVCDVLIDRLRNALNRMNHSALSACVIAGGVAANQAIRHALTPVVAEKNLPLIVPPPVLCTDNAVMIAWAGLERFRLGARDSLDIAPRARWPLVVG